MPGSPHNERFMREAIRLARKARGRTRPNPQVGAVVVRRGEIVGRGYHRKAGLPHAEVEAIRDAGGLAKGSDLYVTLEPCVHHGRTPPCVDAIIAAGIRKVYVGTLDPNPVVNGRGVRKLRRAGVEVETGLLADECRALNEGYNVWIAHGRPHIALKVAASIDGSIADFKGNSRWITSEESRRLVHRMRAMSDAVLVGIGTVLKDDPLLTARGVSTPKGQPLRVVLDSRLRTPARARVLNGDARTLLVCSSKSAAARMRGRYGDGVEILQIGSGAKPVDI
ncbi:MAG TPA: bifunctional diaminohydroxyphosphoribosylaminopyrimidine deaminase/5-amino-6-(5-phosphoribosylamino)uracil reductase RibD, partial [Proteobacteria bacterium]|nr:bifunctional diaminohydroxyphosphoribosylaminopyrimidine deaminase/5-amino-6-(5-phosphoribosylamino)uracil reductase RibD [Pseudomonadota bacterium]